MISLGYFGSPDFSSFFLEKLLTDKDLKKIVKVNFVLTQKDKLAGRKQILTPTPVKKTAQKYHLQVFEIDKFSQENFLKTKNLKLKISQLDIGFIYAYGAIIPKEFLNLPKYGFWCLHPSLLPKYRGVSPIATALINGDKETGATIFQLDEKIDHGPIIAQEKIKININDCRPDLEKKLTELGFEIFKNIFIKKATNFLRFRGVGGPTASKKFVADFINHRQTRFSCDKNFYSEFLLTPQNHSLATYTKKLTKQDGFIPFEKLKSKNLDLKIYNLYRGLYPWPGLWTILPNSKRLKITGMIIKNNQVKITWVQLEGKKETGFETFNKAYKVFPSF